MPGIVGIISSKPPAESEARLKRMLATMRHEKFYKSGTHSVPAMKLYSGWIAFEKITDGIFFNDARDIALIFSGECFLDSEAATGEKLIQLYEQSGQKFFEKLNGLFSGLLIDLRQNKTFLFNDRYGSQRIYFHESDGDFYFASEAKALLRILPELREFDPEGVAQFLAFGCALDWKTIFRGIKILPGGSLWAFENGNCRREKYFSSENWESQPQLSSEDFEGRFQDDFQKNPAALFFWRFKNRYRADRRTGHADDHGVPPAKQWPPNLLHIFWRARRNFGRQNRRASGVGLRS